MVRGLTFLFVFVLTGPITLEVGREFADFGE